MAETIRAERNVVGQQLVGIDLDLVLLLEAAEGRHFGDAFHALNPVAQVPVLEGAQVRQVVLAGLVHQRVLEAPAHAGGVRSQRRRDARRQRSRQALHVFQHPGARPVNVRAVLEDHIDKRVAEEGIAAHHAHVRRADEFGDDGIGDLVLDQVRAAPLPFGEDDHLHVGQVRQWRPAACCAGSRCRRRRARRPA